jgi:hypothetical protein
MIAYTEWHHTIAHTDFASFATDRCRFTSAGRNYNRGQSQQGQRDPSPADACCPGRHFPSTQNLKV